MFLRYFESVDSAVKSCLRHVVLLNALLLAEHFLGTLASLLGALYVDLLGKFAGIGENDRTLGHYLYKALGDRGIVPLTVNHVFQLARRERGYERLMTVENSEKSVNRRDDKVLAVSLVENAVCRDYLKMKLLLTLS